MDNNFWPGYLTNMRAKKDKEYSEKPPNLYGTEQATPLLSEPPLAQGTSLQMPPAETPMLTAPIPPAPAETPSPVDTFSDYWKTPIIGKMPLDKFVQIAGMLSKSINPNEPMGRMGADLYQMGGLASAERARREERESDRQLRAPEDALRMRSLKAQVEQAEKPKQWKEFSESFAGKINPGTGLPFTKPEIERKWLEIETIPKEPKLITDVQQNPETKVWEFGRRNEATGEFKAYRDATDKEKQDKIEGKPEKAEVKDFQIGDKTVPHQWDTKTNKWVPVPGMGGPKWSPKDMTGKEAVDRGKAFKEIQEARLAVINAKNVLSQTTDEIGKPIIRSPEEISGLNTMIKGYEKRIDELSKQYPDLMPTTTQQTVGTLTPEQKATAQQRYAELTKSGMGGAEAIKTINAELNSIQPSQSESKTTTGQSAKESIPPEPPKNIGIK